MSSAAVSSPPRSTTPSGGGGAGGTLMSHREILFVIYGLLAGMFLSSLGQTVFGTAIRTIGDDLKGLDQQAWVTTAYLITSTIATPIYGKLSDIFGRRPLFIFGISVFIAGAVLSSMSTSMLMLAGFRAIQGIGAGALMSLPLAILGDILAPRERAKYQGYFLAVFGIASVIGPLLGGLLAGADQILFITGWRWVLLINVPIGVIALIMVIRFLHLPKVHDRATAPRIDWWGATAIIVALVPLLLVAEQGRTWGWGSIGSIACYVIGAVGLVAFVVIETRMKDDAILPMKLFRSGTFSMAALLGFLVGFAMFGAMLTLPLYLQIVVGLDPTAAGFATLPLVLGLMVASIVSGQLISRIGKYRAFPITGTAFTAVGYILLTFMNIDRPLWFLLIAMFVIGLGLGQLMQTLTFAAQGSVEPRDMGVATSSATFFRQIGGTLGVAVLLSVLFSALPGNIASSLSNEKTLTAGLSAALDPKVADASENAAVMKQIWNKVVDPAKQGIQAQLDAGTQQALAAAPGAPEALVLAGVADKAHASVIDGKVAVDWSDKAQRDFYVAQLEPKIHDQLAKADTASSSSDSSSSDTSFLKGADPRLTRPFLGGFNDSAVIVFWVGFGVIVLAFILTWFFKVPPLRQRSALQERADKHREATEELEQEAVLAANESGSFVAPMTGSIPVVQR
ncbi:EmrB/QacA subfamily drug resistance transporter [Schumannella luteola]|uniref:EmrB/QacA subfamily drug resistance transporter n=1 Tax=Schumannella luteola TaxID=472059 RepID=A0A852Y4C4_9MICO|nr:EmrB/QacA subfamily drug resistance transporter [Schumannella luteola]